MDKLKLNLQVQVILTYCFCVVTNLIQDDKESKEVYGEVSKNLSLLIFKRLQEPDKLDSKISSRFSFFFFFSPSPAEIFILENF